MCTLVYLSISINVLFSLEDKINPIPIYCDTSIFKVPISLSQGCAFQRKWDLHTLIEKVEYVCIRDTFHNKNVIHHKNYQEINDSAEIIYET